MKQNELKQAIVGLIALFLVSILGLGLWLGLKSTSVLAEAGGPKPDPEVTLVAVGDIMLGRDVAKSSSASPEGNDYPFALVKELGKGADIMFGNLESPLVAPENLSNRQSEGYLFPAQPALASNLRNNGFNVLTVANNHALDYGLPGLNDTLHSLDSAGITYIGAGANPYAPRYIEKNGLKLAFIAATRVEPAGLQAGEPSPIALFDQAKILAAIREARPQADVVILALHWGEEYQAVATASQHDFAKLAAEAGADLILGAHPHVLGEFEVIGRTVVAYSLGNFIFDSRYPPESRDSVALYLKLDKRGVASALAVPLKIENDRPRPLKPEEREAALAKLAQLAIGEAFKSQATFWNGADWQSAPALAFVREATPDGTINLPTSRTIQVRDLNIDLGGYTTGKAVSNLASQPQTNQRIELSEGHLRIWRPNPPNGIWQLVWESKPSWSVEQFTFGDADEDGRPEIMFTLWKNDGWDDASQYRSHPFVYGWRRNAIRPVWAGSALVDPIREFALADFDQDGRNELVVLEGVYADARHAPAQHVTVWRWQGWGYELLYRGPEGKFSSLTYAPGQPYAFFKDEG